MQVLATLAFGLSGALVGDSGANAAAQAGKTTVENNALGSVLAAANAIKPGTTEKWQEEQQAAIKEACSGNTPVSCQLAVVAMGTGMSAFILPEAMVTSGIIGSGAVSGVDWLMTGDCRS